MNHKMGFSLAICCAVTALSLTGCGQNIYKGLAGAPTRTASDELKSGNYDAAIAGADAVIDRGETGEALQTAYTVKGTALLMKYQSLPHNIFQTIIDLSDQPESNIVTTLLNAIPIDYENATLAADAFNAADTLANPTILTITAPPPLTPSLNSTAQLNRALANTTVAIKMLTRYLDISSDGSVSKNPYAIENLLTMGDIIQSMTSAPKTLAFYAQAAASAATVSGVFNDDQLVILKRVLLLGKNLDQLRRIADNGHIGMFELVDETGTPVGGYVSVPFYDVNQENAYRTALEQIISAMKTGAIQ